MFSFDPVFVLPEWLQFISVLAMVCGFQTLAFIVLLRFGWGSIEALQASLVAALIGVILSGVLFVGLSI